jgi:hypothetical protein
MTERHFTLGDDWSDFSSLIDDQLVKAAKQGLLKLPGNKLQGRTPSLIPASVSSPRLVTIQTSTLRRRLGAERLSNVRKAQ